jgi:hypothetical protein
MVMTGASMRKNMPEAANDLAMPWARRRWAAVDHMAVRGRSRQSAGATRLRPVAGRMATRRVAEPTAANAAGPPERPARTLGSAAALFVTRVAGHDPLPTGLMATTVASRPAGAATQRPAVAPIAAVLRPGPLAKNAQGAAPCPAVAQPARLPRLPVPPAREFIAPAAYLSLSSRLRAAAFARWRAWLQFCTWRRLPRDIDWLGWRDRLEPTLLGSFALIASAAVLIGLYSFSNGGMYNPGTPAVPSQTSGRPDSPAVTAGAGVRAIREAPGGPHRSAGADGSTVPSGAAVSWPAPSDSTHGLAVGTRPGLPAGGTSAVGRTSAPGGGPAPSPTPSNTPAPPPSPTPTGTPKPSPTDPPTPSPTDTATITPGP